MSAFCPEGLGTCADAAAGPCVVGHPCALVPARQPEWLKRAVMLHDHFDGRITLRVAQPQPQYGTVQLNAEYKDEFISVDVNLADLLAALEACVAPEGPKSPP